ncbi:MAG TPA: ATP-binding protein, partial [Candidatus Omnitrophota bacterium]|nr:ATP-binding protein [Candidatus Omnitrophota bacterium]
LEAMRQPLEDGSIRVTRTARSMIFPARFMLVCAMNPCPCGKFGQPQLQCGCSPKQVQRYHSKISGPLLDRIDIHIEVRALKYRELANEDPSENSISIKQRIIKAHEIQKNRFGKTSNLFNTYMNHRQTRECCRLDKESQALLKRAIEEWHLSTRAYDKILKVARTIADLAGKQEIEPVHVSEAIQYRALDRLDR